MLTEKHHAGGFLISEGDGHYSRDNVTMDSSIATALEPGTVLGKITASGKYVAYDNQASDGSQAAAAILYGSVDVTGADQVACVIVRTAEVNGDELVWPGGSPTDQTAGIADLKTLGIIVR
jgi:Bacteriophage lambda head decoration protein D